MGLRFQPRSLLTLFFIAAFAYAVIEAWDMPVQAKMYPWTIGIVVLVLLAWQLVREVLPARKEEGRETGVDMDFTEEEASRTGKLRAMELFGWLYGFVALLWLVGFFVAIPSMVLLYMLRHRETPLMTILLPAGAGIAAWGIFGELLHLPFPPGILLEMAGLS